LTILDFGFWIESEIIVLNLKSKIQNRTGFGDRRVRAVGALSTLIADGSAKQQRPKMGQQLALVLLTAAPSARGDPRKQKIG